jgi:hypothetical protein
MILVEQFAELVKILWLGQASDFIGWLPPATNGRGFFILILLLSCFLILLIFFAGTRSAVRSFLNNVPDFWYVAFILLFSVAIRLPFIHAINTLPISDFEIINEDAVSLAQGGQPTHMYVATHVVVTMIYGLVYRLFGVDLNVIKIFHAVVYGLSGVFLYCAGRIVFKSKLWAALAAILLVGWPSLIVYSNVLTPEHLFILVECALLLAVAYLFKNPEAIERGTGLSLSSRYVVSSILVGFLIGLLGMFRPFSELFLAAFVCTLLIYTRNLKASIAALFCLLMAFLSIRNVPLTIAEHYQNQFGNVRPCNLLVGLNFEASGQYNTEDQELCSKLRSKNPDNAAFTKTILGIVWERVQKEQNDVIPFVGKKFAILWANSNGILFWATQLVKEGDQGLILDAVQKINSVDFAIMFLITITCVIGTGIAFSKDIKPALFFCLLAFFGFNLMEIPFELQTRYRTVVIPLLIFFASWTFAVMSTRLAKHSANSMQQESA